MADATEHEIWGDRATSLTEAMSVMSSPIQMGTLCHFAMRKGWEQKTLEGVLAYCQRQQLVEPYKAFNGKAAFKLTGASVPAAAATETDADEDDEQPEADEAPAATILDCLCARTAPHKNYGCPEHGGARIKEEPDMAQQWISTAEAALLLGVTKRYTIKLAQTNKVEAKQEGDGARAPFLFRRTSVIAYRDARRKEQAATDLLPATPTKRATKPPKASKALVAAAPAAVEAIVVEPPPALAEVRVLVRWVDRGWFSKDDAWDKLRELVAGQ